MPPLLVLLDFVLPPLLIFTRVGALDVQWLPVRWAGVAVSVYAAAMLLWAAATLGRFLVPQGIGPPAWGDRALEAAGQDLEARRGEVSGQRKVGGYANGPGVSTCSVPSGSAVMPRVAVS